MVKKTLSLLVAMAAICSASLVQAATDDGLDATIQSSSSSIDPAAQPPGNPPCPTPSNGNQCF